jgi:hypothetical protein
VGLAGLASSTTQAPHGGIQWAPWSGTFMPPIMAQQLQATRTDKPELLHRLTG